MIGIYEIVNSKNEKRYIGSSKRIYARWSFHRSKLRANTHYNHYLQRAWNIDGEEIFKFNVIMECSAANLFIEEQKLLDIHFGSNCYNLSKRAEFAGAGHSKSKKERKRIGLAHKGRLFSSSRCSNISESKRGSSVAEEHRIKISNSVKLADCSKYKFSEATFKEIKRLFATGQYTKKALSELFNISQSHIGRIIRGIPRNMRD